jgi:23S rRNA (cytosine1962-C5)-methyltransferase
VPGAPAAADGEVVRLVGRRAGPLGLAVVDRTDACWRRMTRSDEPWAALDIGWIDARLDAARVWRAALGVDGADAAYRLLNGAGDGVSGLLLDVYAAFAVVSALSAALLPVAEATAARLVDRGLARGVVVKHRARGGAAAGIAAVVGTHGAAPPDRLVVREAPWQFEVHLATGVNVGLFGDMRDERRRIATIARGRRVLNLFGYTGTLSVAAATGGAAHVATVDRSEGVLAWARDNAALNGVDPARHRTVADDAARFVAAAVTAGDAFDLVLVDPPSFSTARDAAFAIDRDFAPLVERVCALVPPGGLLWLASNTRGFSLVGAAQAGILSAGRQAQVLVTGGLPADHPTELADAEARYLQTCLLRLA